MVFNRDGDEEDSTFDEVSAMADRLGLKGKNRANYIDDHMVGLGYDAVQSRDSYVRRQQEEGDQGGAAGRWGFGRGSNGGGGSSGTSGRRRRDEDDSF